MIDRTHSLPVVRQCQLLQLARSTAYYQALPVSEMTLALMRRIDELHLQYPFAGARMLRGTRAMPLGDARWPLSCAGWGLRRCIGGRI